ncbi:hypothetical protein QUF58_04305 [Anaerolineales bacterium HSG24]|nr:hypothetical protein [Anaerolineales bacterium HSG24]
MTEKTIHEFKIIETEDGFRIELKGDKEALKRMIFDPKFGFMRSMGYGKPHSESHPDHDDEQHGHGRHGHGRHGHGHHGHGRHGHGHHGHGRHGHGHHGHGRHGHGHHHCHPRKGWVPRFMHKYMEYDLGPWWDEDEEEAHQEPRPHRPKSDAPKSDAPKPDTTKTDAKA